MNIRENMKNKQRIVIKIGSSSLTHKENGSLNLRKIEALVRVLCELKNTGKDVVLVSSGAIAAGRQAAGNLPRPDRISQKQALAAIGQAHLMMTYQRLFSEYSHLTAQILLTKDTLVNSESYRNARNTFEELFRLGSVPIVNENDTIATHEIVFGDNDRLSAVVAALVNADLLILLSDIDGMYTGDPRKNPAATLISDVEKIDADLIAMAGGAGSDVGTGGMAAKLAAAQIATDSGVDMVIANAFDVKNVYRIIDGKECGTLFHAHKNPFFNLKDYIRKY
ncbi:MAG: glutamate 5-kinase [Lachnospiraceae bacterium]|nr:glutamate 5-kinase [Lachnospiraceae bacterium]